MKSLAERTGTAEFKLGVKQYKSVLRFLTDLENEMRERKVKKADLAQRLGKTRAWVSKIFGKKKQNLTFFTAVTLADALGMDVEFRAISRSARVETTPSEVVPMLRLVVANPTATQAFGSDETLSGPLGSSSVSCSECMPLPIGLAA